MLPILLSLLLSVHTWDAVPGAAGYLFCWSHDPAAWSRLLCVDAGLPAPLQFDDTDLDPLLGLEKQHVVIYSQIVAYDSNGTPGMITNGVQLPDPPYAPVCP